MKLYEFLKNNKILSIIISIVILIFAGGIIGNSVIKNKYANWSETVEQRNIETFDQVNEIIKNKQNKFISKRESIVQKLNKIVEPTFAEFDLIISETINDELAIAIFKNDKTLYWNSKYREQFKNDDTLNFNYGETYFLESGLNTYLVSKEKLLIKDVELILFFGEIIEKKYKLNPAYFYKTSLINNIEDRIGTSFTIDYSPYALKSKDGRKYSFEIKNNINKKIGQATFIKLSREKSIITLEENVSTFQGLLLLIGYLFIGYLLSGKFQNHKSAIAKLSFLTIYIIVLRYLLILVKIPKSIISSELLTDKIYFSEFGFGLAYSPLDLLITQIFTLIIFLFYFKSANKFYRSISTLSTVSIIKFSIVLLIGGTIYFLCLRGIGAALRGIVFDSSIRYFQSTSLYVTLPDFVMHINILLLGIISTLGSVSIIFIILSFFKKYVSQNINKSLLITFGAFVVFLFIFIALQNNPQMTVPLKIIQIILIFLSIYFVLTNKVKTLTKIVVLFFVSSSISIGSLLFYNSQLEKSSLKTTANIISRADDIWYKGLIEETLVDNFSHAEAVLAFSNYNTNFNASAFKIWSKSKLQKEAINSSVNFIDLSGKLLGGFGSIYPKADLDKFIDTNSVIEEIQIFEEPLENESQKFIRGIFPIKNDFAFLGYLDVSILSDLNDFGFSSHPEFISTGKLNEKAILKLDKLVFLDYRNGILKTIYGNVNPTSKVNQKILGAEFNNNKDTWLDSELNGVKHIIYIKKVDYNNTERVIAVGLREKELSIGLFDFFKIFFTHTLILLIIVLGSFLYNLNKKKYYQPNLRTQLLTAFLIISLIPFIFTAFYFRNLTEQKNNDATYYKLGKRAFRVENYLVDNYNIIEPENLFAKASRDLNINFSLYKQNILEYSSDDLIYDVGLIPKIVNAKAYDELIKNGSQEVLVEESIDKFVLNSFYYRASLFDDRVIIKVTDGFNKIGLPLTGSEVDVFLFGIYFLAVIMIMIISAIFANQISSPIRKITSATKSVAAGDLSLELKTNAKGEVKELVTGFHNMIRDLKKNQTILAEIEREEAWKEMAKQVAHEIKNPLTPMKLSVQQLVTAYNDKSDKFDNYFQRVTTTLLKQIETLKNIATEFSNFARMPKLKLEEIDCLSNLQEAINLFADENIKIEFNNNKNICLVNGDSEQLKRTLINLFRNSIQAKSKEIKIHIEEYEKHYDLYVNDNGKGIIGDNYEKIFEPNFSTKKEGMGLGLSMARRYLRSTGGDISVISSSPNGTSIKLTLLK